MKKRLRVLSAAAALAVMASTFTPVYANQIDISGLMEDTAVLGYSELLEDEVTKESAWYSWDADNGILTLRGQLPDTDEYKTLADKAGIIGDVVKKVIIERGTKAGTSLTFAFEWFIALESIEGLNNLDTSNVTDMSFMFCSCSSLTSLDVSNFNTTNVINMRSMFNGCSGLTSLDVSNFNTTNVTDMRCMFNGCSSLTSLDVSKFNTANVTDMDGMFYGCSSLTSLDLSKFNTANVTDMLSMFNGCSGLTSLDVSNFNTANVTDMRSMFFKCSSLTSLDVSNFNTANVTDMRSMFNDCSCLTSLDVSNFNTANVTDMRSMFSDCSCLTSLDVSNFNTTNVTDMNSMFYECSCLTSLDVSNFNTANVTDMRSMFNDCSSLTSLDVSKFNTTNVTDMNSMFYECSSLMSLDVSKFNTVNVTDMRGMFYDCSNLTSLDVSKFNTTNVKSVTNMFFGCSGLTSLDLSKFNTSNVKSVNNMFYDCRGLTSLKLSQNFSVKADMLLPNISDDYEGWAKAGTSNIISGTGTYAVFTADTAGEYVRIKSAVSPIITKIEPGYGKMKVSWGAVDGASSYNVYYRTGTAVKKTSRTGTAAMISGIANGDYDVWVTAVVSGRESAQKNIKQAAVKGYYVPCKTTSGMIAGGIKIDWEKFDGATKYRVVCTDTDNNMVGTATTTALTYQWKGLKNNQEYGFYVQPFVDGVYPSFTRTDANDRKYIQWTIPVNAPMITKLSLGNQKVWLYYESVPRATKYYVYYRQAGDTKDTLAGTTTSTKFLVTKLKNNVSTEFYVKALVDGKLTPLKRPATRTTRAGMKPTVTVTSGQAALKWSKYTDCKASATKYKVVFVDANYKQIDTRETANLSFTWKSSALKKGVKYGFYVVPYVNGEYIPFGLSHAEDKANVVMFTAK